MVFLRKIAPGGADEDYGIQVGRLAGLPPETVERAGESSNLEEANWAKPASQTGSAPARKIRTDQFQLLLFE